jgi:hypothetical protein
MLLPAKHSLLFTLALCVALCGYGAERMPLHGGMLRHTTLPIDTFFAHHYPHHPKLLLALKTNLLYDASTAVNAELEAAIGQRWSVAGELVSPWWLLTDRQRCLQLLSGTLEGRYWLGERRKLPALTGWFAGLHVGGGYYDVEWNGRGYQGTHLMAGLSGGYAHAVGRSGRLRLEYALGAGYLGTRYHAYTAVAGFDGAWHLVRRRSGTLSWFGPTRARVSISLMLNQ